MLHPSEPNTTPNRNSIKLTANVQNRQEPVIRHLRSTLVTSKDHTIPIQNKNNDIMANRSMNVQHHNSNLDASNHKRERIITHNVEPKAIWNKQSQNRQSLLASSREIRRMTTDLDDSIHKSREKQIPLIHSRMQHRTPILKKDESQFTNNTSFIHTIQEGLTQQQKTHFQNQIQQLMNRIQYYQNQCRNLKSQNDNLHRNLGAPKQILQRELENKVFRIEDVEKRLQTKNKQYLDKCLENQKHMAKTTQLQNMVRKLQFERDKAIKELEWQKQTVKNIVKQLNDSKAATAKAESEKKKVIFECEQQRIKIKNLQRQKRQLQVELQKVSKIKQLVKQLQQSDHDQAEIIKKHIAYEVQLIDLNGVMASNLQTHKHDLKVTGQQHQSINNEIQAITAQIAVKIKDVLEQKQKVEDQLAQARAETQRIRKSMFEGYQDIIANLKDQLILLKQENVNLSSNSQSKITIAKLQREIKIYTNKVQDLMIRNRQLQQAFERLREKDQSKSNSEIPTQTSIRALDYYDRAGPTDLESIIMTYETRSMDLNSRIQEKQMNQMQLKYRLQQLEEEVRQLKSQTQFSNRKDKTDTDNIKTQLQSMKMQLKSETDSLNRKIQALQKNIQRKNKEIKEKDNFITHYLIQKIKGQAEVKLIVQEIDKYFNEVQNNKK